MSLFGRFAAMLALVAMLVPAAVFAWPHDAVGQIVQSGAFYSQSASDGSGGVYVAYSAYSFVTSTYDVYVQRLDADGKPVWLTPTLVCEAVDAQLVSAIAPDSYGGCVIVWTDYRTQATTGADYYCQRVYPGGTLAWSGTSGVPIVTATGTQSNIQLACDNFYAYFVWTDPRTPATGNDIYMQTITQWSGAPNLGGGAVICNAVGDQTEPSIALDGFQTLRVAWTDYRSVVPDIYAASMNWNGLRNWADNGVAVCTAASYQLSPKIALASGGRSVLTWQDVRGASYDIYAQVLNDYGGSVWATNGVVVCDATDHQSSPEVVVDTNGEYVFAWIDNRRGWLYSDIYAQKLDAAGAGQWYPNGVGVRSASGNAYLPRMVADATGGTYLAWSDRRVDISDVYAQRLSSYGGAMWSANGVRVGTGPGSQAGVTVVAQPGGGLRLTWDDYGNAITGVRHQFVDEWGYAGANPTLASVKDIPNDQGGQVKVSWYGSPLDTDPVYRNISDYVVYRSVPTALAAQLARAAVATEDGVSLNGKRYLRTTSAAQDYFWEELAHVTPRHLPTYSYVAATEGDSMGGSNKKTVFMIMAIGNYGAAWWTSNADSGYSVDNVAPAAPAPLTGQYTPVATRLHWDPNAETDLAGYRVYRGTSVSFTPSPATLLAAVVDTGYVAGGSTPYFYKVSAVDIHGNESPVATLMPSGTLGVGDGGVARAAFAAPAPNPLRGGAASTLRFSLAVGGRTKLALYDAQGRVARVLVDGAREAGEHAVTLKGAGLAPGLYLARLESPGFAATRRVLVIE